MGAEDHIPQNEMNNTSLPFEGHDTMMGVRLDSGDIQITVMVSCLNLWAQLLLLFAGAGVSVCIIYA